MSHQLQKNEIHSIIIQQLAELPPIIFFDLLYPVLGLPSIDAARRRYNRGTLGVRVREFGKKLGVLKIDLAIYLSNGVPQEQPKLQRPARNPKGINGCNKKNKLVRGVKC